MLGYISSTRKKSCYACVKSKRRCDLGYPFCKRCFVKGIDCKYPNAAPRETTKVTKTVPAEVVIRQSTPDFTTPQTHSIGLPSIDPLFFPLDGSNDSPGSSSTQESYHNLQIQDDWGVEMPPLLPRPQLTRMPVLDVPYPVFLNSAQTGYIVKSLYGFMPTMAYTGSTLFLHKNLYQTNQPPAYQDCVAICALYLTKTARNEQILTNSIAAKILGLIALSTSWTLIEHLAAVQALIIYQAIRLFDPDLNLQTEATKHNALLELWSALLWKRAFNEKPSFDSDYDCWVFYESLRRTIIMSVFVRCGWSCFSRGGLADQVPLLNRLPLTKDFAAWSCEGEEWGRRGLCEGKEVVSYGDLTGMWSVDCSLNDLDPFGKLLLAACRVDDPRLLS